MPNKESVVSTQKPTGRIPEEYSKIPEFRVPSKIYKTVNIHDVV